MNVRLCVEHEVSITKTLGGFHFVKVVGATPWLCQWHGLQDMTEASSFHQLRLQMHSLGHVYMVAKDQLYLYPFAFLLLYPKNNHLGSLPGFCGDMVYLSKSWKCYCQGSGSIIWNTQNFLNLLRVPFLTLECYAVHVSSDFSLNLNAMLCMAVLTFP